MAKYFKQYGLKVSTQIGLASKEKSRCAFNHVDLTVTPKPYLDYFKTFPNGVNTSPVDISKSLVCHESLVTSDDGYQGAVIVKTNLNYGGEPELNRIKKAGILRQDEILMNHTNTRFIDPNNYPIYESIIDAPLDIWKNPNLVVQKFRAEMDNHGRYCLRYWYVLDNKGFHTKLATEKPIVKGDDNRDRQILYELTPTALLQDKERLCVNYGRFDYIISNGGVVLFDVNRTLCIESNTLTLCQNELQEMSMGIYDFLD